MVESSWLQPVMHLAVRTHVKNSSGLSFHWIPAVNAQKKLLRQRWIQNIHRTFALPKDENIFISLNHFRTDCF